MKSKRKKNNANDLTMEEHVRELRRRVCVILITLICSCLICLFYSSSLLKWFIQLGSNYGYTVVSLSPQETVLQQLRVTIMSAVILCIPVVLYQVIAFVAPVFEEHKVKLKMLLIVAMAMLCAVVGSLFVIKCLFPIVMQYFVDASNNVAIQTTVSLENLVSLVYILLGYISLAFELPLMCVLLGRYGILSAEVMKKASGVITVIIFVLSAIITPPDVVSQILIAVPLVLLYQLSILLCKVFSKHKRGE